MLAGRCSLCPMAVFMLRDRGKDLPLERLLKSLDEFIAPCRRLKVPYRPIMLINIIIWCDRIPAGFHYARYCGSHRPCSKAPALARLVLK